VAKEEAVKRRELDVRAVVLAMEAGQSCPFKVKLIRIGRRLTAVVKAVTKENTQSTHLFKTQSETHGCGS